MTSLVNFIPSSTFAPGSPLSAIAGAVEPNNVNVDALADGVTAFDAAEAGPVPIAFVAVTTNVYAVPFVSELTVVDVAGGVPVTVVGVCAVAPMNGVTVYDVIALPLFAGADQLTVADAFPAVAVTAVGAPGAVGAGPEGVTAFDAADAAPAPKTLAAVTANVYAVPFFSPVTVSVVAFDLNVCAARALVPMYGVMT